MKSNIEIRKNPNKPLKTLAKKEKISCEFLICVCVIKKNSIKMALAHKQPPSTQQQQLREFDFGTIPVGAAILIVGKRCSGKSCMQRAIIESMASRFSMAFALAPTSGPREELRKHMPRWCVFELSISVLRRLMDMMKRRYEKFKKIYNKKIDWLLVLDDTAYDEKFMKSVELREVFANGRHFGCTVIITTQYMKAAPPIMRTNSDFVFCFIEQNETARKALHDSFFSCVPKSMFEAVFMRATQNYSSLVVNNRNPNKTWTDMVFWKRAPVDTPHFTIGTPTMWEIDRRCFRADPDDDNAQGREQVLLMPQPSEPVPSSSNNLPEPEGDDFNLSDFSFSD